MFHRLFDDPGQFFLPGIVVGVATLLVLSYRQRTGDARTPRMAAAVILVLWLGFVVYAALIGPTNLAAGLPRPSFNLVPFGSFVSDEIASRESREVIGNLVLFFPLGAFLPFVSSRFTTWWRPALIAFFFSFALEFAQYLLNLGRLADIDDAILNSTGAVLGSVSWRGLATFRAQA